MKESGRQRGSEYSLYKTAGRLLERRLGLRTVAREDWGGRVRS